MRPEYATPASEYPSAEAILEKLHSLAAESPWEGKEIDTDHARYVAELCEELVTFRANSGGGRHILESTIEALSEVAFNARNPSFLCALGQMSTNPQHREYVMNAYYALVITDPVDEKGFHSPFVDFYDNVKDDVFRHQERIPNSTGYTSPEAHIATLKEAFWNALDKSTHTRSPTLAAIGYRIHRLTELLEGRATADAALDSMAYQAMEHPNAIHAMYHFAYLTGKAGIPNHYDTLAEQLSELSNQMLREAFAKDPAFKKMIHEAIAEEHFKGAKGLEDTLKDSFTFKALQERLKNSGYKGPKLG